jgi:hypothetical protein
MQLAALFTSALGVLNGFAHVQRLGQRQLVGVRQQLVGKLDHDAFARSRRHAAPLARLERGTGHGHRRVHIGLAATGHGREHAAIDRGDAVKRLSIGSGDALAVDERTPVERRGVGQMGHGWQLLSSLGCGHHATPPVRPCGYSARTAIFLELAHENHR